MQEHKFLRIWLPEFLNKPPALHTHEIFSSSHLFQAFILVYSPSEPGSLEIVTQIFHEIKELRPLDFNLNPIVLVENKSDYDLNPDPAHRSSMIERWILLNGAAHCKFAHINTSAKTGKSEIFRGQKIAGNFVSQKSPDINF